MADYGGDSRYRRNPSGTGSGAGSIRVPKSSRPGARMPAMESGGYDSGGRRGGGGLPSQGSAFQPVRPGRRLPDAPSAGGNRGEDNGGRMSKLLRGIADCC